MGEKWSDLPIFDPTLYRMSWLLSGCYLQKICQHSIIEQPVHRQMAYIKHMPTLTINEMQANFDVAKCPSNVGKSILQKKLSVK